MANPKTKSDLSEQVRAAAGGDRAAARAVLEGIQDDVYGFALRMLGHPSDAEDAAQEVLVIVLTHLGSFRGESSFQTWVWRIASNHLMRTRKGRRETVTFEILDDRLRTGLREEPSARPGPEEEALAREVRLRCTQAMILSLDRELRLAYLLGEVFELSGEEAAEILDIEPAAFRKRLSRARTRVHDFMRGWCGVHDPGNPCRCAKQVDGVIERGLLAADDLYLSNQRSQPTRAALDRATDEMSALIQVAAVIRGPTSYLAPLGMAQRLRELLDSQRLELLNY